MTRTVLIHIQLNCEFFAGCSEVETGQCMDSFVRRDEKKGPLQRGGRSGELAFSGGSTVIRGRRSMRNSVTLNQRTVSRVTNDRNILSRSRMESGHIAIIVWLTDLTNQK